MTDPLTAPAERPLHGPGLTDVRMMLVAHSSFRREIGLSAGVVRRVADGDRRRPGSSRTTSSCSSTCCTTTTPSRTSCSGSG